MSAEPRVGVFVCHPADSAEGPVDLQAVVAYAKGLPRVASARLALERRFPEYASEICQEVAPRLRARS